MGSWGMIFGFEPEYCDLIIKGEQTGFVVRGNLTRVDLGIKRVKRCFQKGYIYCRGVKENRSLPKSLWSSPVAKLGSKVIGEFDIGLGYEVFSVEVNNKVDYYIVKPRGAFRWKEAQELNANGNNVKMLRNLKDFIPIGDPVPKAQDLQDPEHEMLYSVEMKNIVIYDKPKTFADFVGCGDNIIEKNIAKEEAENKRRFEAGLISKADYDKRCRGVEKIKKRDFKLEKCYQVVWKLKEDKEREEREREEKEKGERNIIE